MTFSATKRLVPDILQRLQKELGLQNWRIRVEYNGEKQEGEPGLLPLANVNTNYEREKAAILLHYDNIADEEALEEVLLHELFHIVLAPYDVLWKVLQSSNKKPSKEFLDLFEIQTEITIRNMEKMYAAIKSHKGGNNE